MNCETVTTCDIESKESNTITKGRLYYLNDRIALVRIREGEVLNGTVMHEILNYVKRRLPGDFGVILDETTHYFIQPISMRPVLNACDALKGLAIVQASGGSKAVLSIQQKLFTVPVATFQHCSQALSWLLLKF